MITIAAHNKSMTRKIGNIFSFFFFFFFYLYKSWSWTPLNNKQINSWQAKMRLFAQKKICLNQCKPNRMPKKKQISRQFHVWSLILLTIKKKQTRSHKSAAPVEFAISTKYSPIHKIQCTIFYIYFIFIYMYFDCTRSTG